jgi:hypothetical protein
MFLAAFLAAAPMPHGEGTAGDGLVPPAWTESPVAIN